MQILSVAAFTHLQGVVHRDLKPEVSVLYNFFHLAMLNLTLFLIKLWFLTSFKRNDARAELSF